ncbi:hypothetical protein BKA56DRAFT_602761 [Ilyonectria sp. MPI-CAGE-AT-0026]|nr:hypothetical protein BKA56DRAFT_602761 [Ilyonectria sp. MPI-CAGE-AT-0026]
MPHPLSIFRGLLSCLLLGKNMPFPHWLPVPFPRAIVTSCALPHSGRSHPSLTSPSKSFPSQTPVLSIWNSMIHTVQDCLFTLPPHKTLQRDGLRDDRG